MKIIDVRPYDNYILQIVANDGRVGTFDVRAQEKITCSIAMKFVLFKINTYQFLVSYLMPEIE